MILRVSYLFQGEVLLPGRWRNFRCVVLVLVLLQPQCFYVFYTYLVPDLKLSYRPSLTMLGLGLSSPVCLVSNTLRIFHDRNPWMFVACYVLFEERGRIPN